MAREIRQRTRCRVFASLGAATTLPAALLAGFVCGSSSSSALRSGIPPPRSEGALQTLAHGRWRWQSVSLA